MSGTQVSFMLATYISLTWNCFPLTNFLSSVWFIVALWFIDIHICKYVYVHLCWYFSCKWLNFEVFDQVYHQLENLSQANPPYKSIAALNCVILGCANIWDLDRAYQTFASIRDIFGLAPNIHSYNALICAFGKLGKVPKVHPKSPLYYLYCFNYVAPLSNWVKPLRKLYSNYVCKQYFHQASWLYKTLHSFF